MEEKRPPVAPGDIEPGRFRRLGLETLDSILEYHGALADRCVLPPVTPRDVEELFVGELPEEGEEPEALLQDWRRRVSPLLTAVGSPRNFAYVIGSGAMIGILAEALAASTGTNAGAWNLGPAATEIERQCLRWIARFIAYPEDSGGILCSGGTMANVTALLAALRHVAPYDSTPEGLQDGRRSGRFLVYVSDHEGHVSVVRAADMLNLGRNAVRRVASRPDLTMDPAALESCLVEDRRRGDIPFAVVAQLGSVNVGAVDPIAELADVCSRHGVWLHGDGAIGLLAAGVPETAGLFRGLSRADSLSTDPHKWLGVPPDCGLVLVRHGERLRRAFSISAPYLRAEGGEPSEALDYRDYGPQLSRGFRALKVWMTLRFFGARGLRGLIEKNLALTRHLHGLVREHPEFEALHDPVLPILSFRYRPSRLLEEDGGADHAAFLDRLNQEIAEFVQRSGVAFVMTTRIRGRVALRVSVCSQRTERADIDTTFEAIAAAGHRLVRLGLGRNETNDDRAA